MKIYKNCDGKKIDKCKQCKSCEDTIFCFTCINEKSPSLKEIENEYTIPSWCPLDDWEATK